ncbi:phosphotransferase [Amnibacterium flavum]|uniref:maltokinase N-terminal cap-like domain-containing protein n=1 Tax=Amnibacterium flavum TaxID=2173173 RepID=UPI00140250FE|nr:phosphotransferase [Amnibacterium flavum]
MNELVEDPAFASWVGRQRWYSGAGSSPRLTLTASYPLDLGDSAARGVVAIVADADGAHYQVPLAFGSAGEARPETITTLDGVPVSDGTRDQAVAAALLTLAMSVGVRSGDGITVSGQPFGHAPVSIARSRVLSGEQSNTSIIFDLTDPSGTPTTSAILKVFRVVHHGDNPDVVLQSAIAAAGSTRVPRSLGAVVGEWGEGRGHLAFAQEFLPDTRDAWRVALDAATAGEDFTERARALGAATAEVHGVLAATMPTEPPSADRVESIGRSFRERMFAAFVAVPALERFLGAIETIYDQAADEPWPAFQRVHGDYHLGQVLEVPGRGWVLLDFEGEPLRPMTERNAADLALRDVAGMLRSFDYAAGSVTLADPSRAAAATEWAAAARAAFLDGYEHGGGDPIDAHPALLTALELDKALYEALYEARNRPDWLPIPTLAIARLVLAGEPLDEQTPSGSDSESTGVSE